MKGNHKGIAKRIVAGISAILFAFLLFSCKTKEIIEPNRGEGWAKKVQAKTLVNLYQVDEVLYRCEQPTALAMKELEQQGIKTVLNLRKMKNDPQPGDAKLKWVHVRINTWTISYNDVLRALKEIEKAEKPLVVHCKHGSDRTGAVIAAWNIVKHNHSKEEAIRELRFGGYHFHEKYFKNIIRLVNSLDVEKLKKDLAG